MKKAIPIGVNSSQKLREEEYDDSRISGAENHSNADYTAKEIWKDNQYE